jgi:hypothetical protein
MSAFNKEYCTAAPGKQWYTDIVTGGAHRHHLLLHRRLEYLPLLHSYSTKQNTVSSLACLHLGCRHGEIDLFPDIPARGQLLVGFIYNQNFNLHYLGLKWLNQGFERHA